MKILVICACLLGLSSAHAGALAVRLESVVTVESENLRLSDLLAAGVPPQLEMYAQKISLGRAPDVGSLRVFTGSELRAAVSAKFPSSRQLAAIEIPEQVIVRRSGWPLDREAVRQALIQSKLAPQFVFLPAQIALPSNFSTRTLHPQLEILSLARSQDQHSLLARVRCRVRSSCGTFLAEISFPDSFTNTSINFSPGHEAVGHAIRTKIPTLPLRGPVLVHPGTPALLIIQGDGFKISQRVMPLKRGHLGELVRISDPMTHRSRLAEVTGSGMLGPPSSSREGEAR
jgi:hypothetical protein